MQGFPFFEKPMRLQYAVGKSDAVAKIDGSFRPRDKRVVSAKNQEAVGELKDRKRKFLAEHDQKLQAQQHENREAARKYDAEQRELAEENMPNKLLFVKNLPETTTADMLKMLFEQVSQGDGGLGAGGRRLARACSLARRWRLTTPPHSPARSPSPQFPGFVEVRMVPQKPGIAFVEFEDEGKAAVARSGLQDFKIQEGHSMTIVFAKR